VTLSRLLMTATHHLLAAGVTFCQVTACQALSLTVILSFAMWAADQAAAVQDAAAVPVRLIDLRGCKALVAADTKSSRSEPQP
jgi:predicted ABC-type sugar transport system permease subunit